MFKVILLIFLISCSSLSKLDQDYCVLEKEQAKALRVSDTKFEQNILDLEKYRLKIITLLNKRTSINDSKIALLNSFILGNRKIQDQIKGAPFFHSFYGNWIGTWSEKEKLTKYSHVWEKPYQKDGYIFQKVLITDVKARKTISAINSFDSKKHKILGAVDLKNRANGTDAPHYGIYINEKELIWVARFGNNKDFPYYSIYFEKVFSLDNKSYYGVDGIGFSIDRKKGKVIFHSLKTGRYVKQ
ncbi:MAG: hypothetical protein N4A33_04050 [Bacteriovoracaceae bacterium]|jgi:hypothetical protein|nr:hypothetical protein [Bacteriovoracaceae bacterium]